MSKFRYSYAVNLHLAFPNLEAPKDFGRGITKRQIDEAEKIFNDRFSGRKELSVFQVEDQWISMLLLTSYEPNNVTREVSAFSQILVKEYNFDKYSAKPGRLFNANSQSLPEQREPSKELDDEDEANAERARREKEDTDQMAIDQSYVCATTEEYETGVKQITRLRPLKRKFNTFVTMSNEILGTDSIGRLDNYIKQLEDLTTLAKTKKSIMARSKK